MSIMSLRKMFRRPIKVKVNGGKRHISLPSLAALVFGFLVIAFLISAYYSFGPSGRGGSDDTGAGGARHLVPVMATVGDRKITRAQFEDALTQQTEMTPGGNRIAQQAQLKFELLQQFTQRELLLSAAAAEGIRVGKAQIQDEINTSVQQTLALRYPTQEALFKYLQSQNMSREDLEKSLREKQAADLEPLRERLLVKGLQDKVESGVVVDPTTVRNWYTEVHASHILISPQGLMQQAAQPDAQGQTTPLTKAQADALAQQKAQDLLAQIRNGADFAALAQANSDDPGSKPKGGDVGWVKHGQMVPEFEQTAFALQPGQVSEAVKSEFGYHIVKVGEQRSTLPADFDKNQQKYTDEVTRQLKQQAWTTYMASLKEKTKVEILDPELRGLTALQEGSLEDAKTLLTQAAQDDPDNATARLTLAQILMQEQNWPVASQYLEELSKTERAASDPSVWMALGQVREKQGQTDAAIEAYTAASDRAAAPEMENFGLHMALKSKFQAFGKTDLVRQEDAWVADFKEVQQERAGSGQPSGGTIQMPPG